MAATQDFDIVGSYNNQRITSIDAERSVNLFEYIDPLGKKTKALLGTSGLVNTDIVFTGITGGFRAQFFFLGETYAVIGNTIVRIAPNNTYSVLGTMATATGYVGIDANTFQVIFVDGLNGYIWDTNANTLTTIVDSNFPVAPIDVCFLDGFFVVAAGATNTFVLSQLNDGITYTPLQQGAITSHPGTIVACRTLHRRLFLFSQYYTEVWENAGIGTNLPFRRNNSLLMEYGTPAVGSIAVGFDKLFFLSQDRDGLGSVMEVIGTQSIPVSNRALDFQLAQYAANQTQGVADCRGFLIKESGLIFYRMNFTAANHTFVYNVTLSNPGAEETKYWHEEEVLNGDRHPAQTHAFVNGMNYVGHYSKPTLYIIDPFTYTNDGEAIRRMRITKAFVPPGYQRIRIDRLQVDLLQGQFSQADQTTTELDLLTEDAYLIDTEDGFDLLLEQSLSNFIATTYYMFLSISKDGGQIYGYLDKAPLGAVGQRTYRTLWRKKGTIPRGQAFVGKFEIFDAIPIAIMGACWAIEVMPE